MSGLILPFEGAVPTIAPDAFVAETATVIGNATIGSGSGIWYGCVVRGDVESITIGANTNIQDGTIIHVNHDRGQGGEPTHIGDNVTVGHMALIHACTVEDDAFIGMRAVVMDRAVIESHAMVAAGAVVTPGKIVRSGQLWSGTPAKHMRDLTEKELAYFTYSADNYRKLAEQYLARLGTTG